MNLWILLRILINLLNFWEYISILTVRIRLNIFHPISNLFRLFDAFFDFLSCFYIYWWVHIFLNFCQLLRFNTWRIQGNLFFFVLVFIEQVWEFIFEFFILLFLFNLKLLVNGIKSIIQTNLLLYRLLLTYYLLLSKFFKLLKTVKTHFI